MTELYDLLQQSSEGDENAILTLIGKFRPLLNKYANLLGHEDSYNDLLYDFLVMLKSFKSQKIRSKENHSMLSYIRECVINSYKRLLRQYGKEKAQLISLPEHSDGEDSYIAIWDKLLFVNDEYTKPEYLQLEFEFLHTILTQYEADIIIRRFFYHFSIKEIAEYYGVSLPAISQAKNNALKKLRYKI